MKASVHILAALALALLLPAAADAQNRITRPTSPKAQPQRTERPKPALAPQQNRVNNENPSELYAKGEQLLSQGKQTEARTYFRKAAEQGHAEAASQLGDLYYEGNGVPKNFAEALKWYRIAADKGYAYAQYSLGFMYEHAQGGTENIYEAVNWYRKAAGQGDESAKKALDKLGYSE